MSRLRLEEPTGIVLGYELTKPIFRPVLERAGKKEAGWKIPTFIESLASDPSPLILQEHWLYDRTALETAWAQVEAATPEVSRLRQLFERSDRFQTISFQDLIDEPEDIDAIAEVMDRCLHAEGFRQACRPMEDVYGWYARPNNYDFERMNAGVANRLVERHPYLVPLDDSLRSPVYEVLGLEELERVSNRVDELQKVLNVVRENCIPLPDLGSAWTPEDFTRLHGSAAARQLREKVEEIRRLRARWDLDPVPALVNDARDRALTLADGRGVMWAFASLGWSGLGVAGALANPLFLIPSAVLGAMTAHQLFSTLRDWSSRNKLTWFEVAKSLARWAQLGQSRKAEARRD